MSGAIDWLHHDTAGLLLLCVVAIALLLFLIIKVKLEPFISLLATSLFLALAAGLNVRTIVGTALKSSDSLLEKGFGGILGHIAVIIGLGTVLGALLEKSGGADVLSRRLLKLFGPKGTPVAMGLVGLIFGIPVFFDIGIFVLAPLVYVAAKRGGKSLVLYALPVLAGLSMTHAFLPPHPGPTAVAGSASCGHGLADHHRSRLRSARLRRGRHPLAALHRAAGAGECAGRVCRRGQQRRGEARAVTGPGAVRDPAAAGTDPRRHLRHADPRSGPGSAQCADVPRQPGRGPADRSTAGLLPARRTAWHDELRVQRTEQQLAQAGRHDPARRRRGRLLRRGDLRDRGRRGAGQESVQRRPPRPTARLRHLRAACESPKARQRSPSSPLAASSAHCSPPRATRRRTSR